MVPNRTKHHICVKVFKNGPSKICGRQLLKNLKWYGLPKQTIPTTSNFLKAVFHKFYLVWPISSKSNLTCLFVNSKYFLQHLFWQNVFKTVNYCVFFEIMLSIHGFTISILVFNFRLFSIFNIFYIVDDSKYTYI